MKSCYGKDPGNGAVKQNQCGGVMTELQIEYFINVAKNMSFSVTAETMFVSQAAVSRQIAALEEELGVKLFTRKYRRLSLTGAGEILLETFTRHRSEFQEALAEAKKHQNANALTINIGLLEGIDMDQIYLSLLEFSRQNPEHTINISIASISSLIEGISNGSYDLVFTFHQELKGNKYIQATPALSARFQFYIASSHPLAKKTDLSLKDLSEETFVAPINDSDYVRREYGNRLYSICGFLPKKLICKSNLDSVMAEVRYNNCVAMLYDLTLLAKKESFRIIETNSFNHISCLRSRANTNPLLPRLIRHLTPVML